MLSNDTRIKKFLLVKEQKFLLEKVQKLASIIAFFMYYYTKKSVFFSFLVGKTDFSKKFLLKGHN